MALEILSIAPFIVLIIYMLKNPEKVEKWSSIFARLFSHFSKKAERHSISADIQSRLSSYIRNYGVEGVLPYGLRFKWVDKGNFGSYVKDGDVVVIMDVHQNNARNFVNAIIAYTAQGLFPSVRPYLPEDVLIASELLVQEKIILEKRPDALEIFHKDIIPERLKDMAEAKKLKDRLESIDRGGSFESVFLSELTFAGARFKQHDKLVANEELEQLIGLLDYITNRDPHDESKPLQYSGKVFNLWLILVARQSRMEADGTRPYLRRAEEAISKRYDSIYLLARDEKGQFLDSVAEVIKENTKASFRWKKTFKSIRADNKKTDSIVCLFRT